MTTVIKKVEYFYTVVPDKAGESAKILNTLKKAGVNLDAFIGFPLQDGQAQLDFVPSDREAFLSAFKESSLELVGPKVAFMMQGEDRVGAVTNVLDKLERVEINITAFHAITAGEGRFGAIFWVKPVNIDQAAEILAVS